MSYGSGNGQPQPLSRERSSTGLSTSSVSSSLPSSPGPSVSLRAMRSSTPTPAQSTSASQISSPRFLSSRSREASFMSAGGNYASSSKRALPSSGGGALGSGLNSAGGVRDRSISQASTARTSAQHSRRRPTLMGGGRAGAKQLQSYSIPPVPSPPPVIITPGERPEDVDVSLIGREGGGHDPSSGVDGLFARFGVKEVKSIAHRSRLKADGKREELRTMVGERYRDLLSAADSIVRMRRASSTLLSNLSRARDECDRSLMTSRAAEEDMVRSRLIARTTTPPTSGLSHYSIATLVKLLLDCPEHIWRAIESEDYLGAARLEGIGRAVYRELVSSKSGTQSQHRASAGGDGINGQRQLDDEDVEGEEDEEDLRTVFPLMEGQWESLAQLGPQISSRANTHLRSWSVTAREVAESLAAILMLDNIALPEALDLLLSQRSKTLDATFSPPTQYARPSISAAASPVIRRPSARSQATVTAVGSAQLPSSMQQNSEREVEEVLAKTREALGLILATLEHVLTIFTRKEGQAGEPLLLRLLDLLQQAPPPSAVQAVSDQKAVTKASILAPQQPAAEPDQVDSLPSVLNTLPNAHLLLRYLPSQILSFTPFIDTTSTRNELPSETVTKKMAAWFDKSVQTLSSGIDELFASLSTAKQLAMARDGLQSFLRSRPTTTLDAQVARLLESLEASLSSRFVAIYELRLDQLTASLPSTIEKALDALTGSKEDLDITQFLFPLTASHTSARNSLFPSARPAAASSFALSTSTKSLALEAELDADLSLKTALAKRISGRSPVLDQCLDELETASRDLRADISTWLTESDDAGKKHSQSTQRDEYLRAVRETVKNVKASMREALEREKDANGMERQIFIGNLALHLALDSTFIGDLLLYKRSTDVPEETKANLLAIQDLSLDRWRDDAVRKAASALRSALEESLARPATATPSRPSEYIFAPLQILLQAARAVGPHRSQAASSSITGLLQAYEDEVVQNVYMTSDLTSTYVEQTRIDVTFLEGMLDAALGRKDQPSRWTAVSKRLSSLASTPSDPAHSAASQHALLRSQTLLAPLLPNLYTPTLSTEVGLSLLLPLGAPPTLAAADVKLDLAKPGARFALLPVNATAA